MDLTTTNLHSDLDTVMGTVTRIPRLLNAEDFDEWKFRFKKYAKMKDNKIWKSIVRGSIIITNTLEHGTVVIKSPEEYSNEDFDLTEVDDRALATITMALSPDIAERYREYKFAKALWEALIKVYEGNEDMRQSRHDLLRQRFNLFNHVLGETLEAQLQRFITLNTELSTAGIVLSRSKINKKLLNSLPRNWAMHVAVIKRTKDLNSLSLSKILAVIKACDMDDKQLEINYANSYQSANLGVSTNSAFFAFPAYAPVYQASSSSSKPMASPVPSIPVTPAPNLPK
ncbi:hypothetical protein L2E82_38115 [Cichorium intybus]|uniref:Uncharacterized protein n=1 Tax=Cichorium intybus TaxID=13427 RepID=A0ACB9AGE8_CICIN|nr:hypothetical protein L2E82_38115 [Cichorium intybus]